MKNHSTNSLRFIAAAFGLVVALLANHARAAVTYWDPEGTFTPTAPSKAYTGQASSKTPPVPGTLAGTWETSSWSTSGTGVAAPVAWIEGTAGCFAVGGGSTNNPNGVPDSTVNFTVTMNANHIVAGMFVGILTPNAVNVTINGAGTMTNLTGNLNGFALYDSSDGALANMTIDVPLAGGTTAGICPEYNGQLSLNGINTYSGGTYLGYNGLSFGAAVWNFNNPASFGTGPIVILNSTGGALVAEGNSPFTITNAVTMYQKYSANVNTVGSLPVIPQ